MKQNFYKICLLLCICFSTSTLKAQDGAMVKTTTDITIDNVGNALCEFKTKYSAMYWDNFLKTVGNNTSILKNQLIKAFPKYELRDFSYSQDADERTNSIKFKMLGAMKIDKNGKWTTDLDQKNPDITKLSEKEFLLMESGNALKIHLPEGTTDAKIVPNNFGKAVLTYSADLAGPMGSWPLYLGIGMLVAGGFLLFKNRKKQNASPVYIPVDPRIDNRGGGNYINQPNRVDVAAPQKDEIYKTANTAPHNRPTDN